MPHELVWEESGVIIQYIEPLSSSCHTSAISELFSDQHIDVVIRKLV